jgi:lactoylglutathione lyase
MTIEITAFGHAGIRVTERERSLRFYRALGFEETEWYPEHRVSILRNPAGLEINLIANAEQAPDGANVLMDVPAKHPGYTHVAFQVASVDALVAELAAAGIVIAEGPIPLGKGYRALFVRDPDRNVIELGEKQGSD